MRLTQQSKDEILSLFDNTKLTYLEISQLVNVGVGSVQRLVVLLRTPEEISSRKFANRSAAMRGSKNPKYKEDRKDNGYLCHDVDGKRLLTHRALYGNIPEGYVIHHIDCNKTNNDIDNLVALPIGEHMRVHAFLRKGDLVNAQLIVDLFKGGQDA